MRSCTMTTELSILLAQIEVIMHNMEKDLENILTYLDEKRGFDFSGYRPSMVERCISKRIRQTKNKDFVQYLDFINEHSDELNNLLDVLSINVSRFFRNTLTFEYISRKILPTIISEKMQAKDSSLRIWSAGCAHGEEPYSLAIILNELLENEDLALDLVLFGTDIDRNALKMAEEAIYPYESIKNIKYRLLKKYFTATGECYLLRHQIKRMVTFSIYDLFDKKSYVPPDSVFGDFDMVFCRNVLIYLLSEPQNILFNKLYRSMTEGGYLILGEAEAPTKKYQRYLPRINDWCHIYRKI